MWNMNASFNMYMFHGATNFEYWAGAESSPFVTVTTSYDYDAPVSEAGDLTPKWSALRSMMEDLTKTPNPYPVPPNTTKLALGKVLLQPLGTVLDLLPLLAPRDKVVESQYPLSMEQIDHPYGYVLYETTLQSEARTLTFSDIVRDRAHVILDSQLIKIIDREFTKQEVIDVAGIAKANSTLQILLENRGRICYGKDINDSKGLVGNVTMNSDQILESWKIYPIDLSLLAADLQRCTKKSTSLLKCLNRTKPRKITPNTFLPTVYAGTVPFTGPALADTFLSPEGWSKGQAFVNGKNLGRYWPARGPQVTLYVPGPYLTQPTSSVMLLELDNPGNCQEDGDCFIEFVDKHRLSKGKSEPVMDWTRKRLGV